MTKNADGRVMDLGGVERDDHQDYFQRRLWESRREKGADGCGELNGRAADGALERVHWAPCWAVADTIRNV